MRLLRRSPFIRRLTDITDRFEEKLEARVERRGEAEAMTHCRSGRHEWTEENTYIVGTRGTRRCRLCMEEVRQRAEAKRQEAAA